MLRRHGFDRADIIIIIDRPPITVRFFLLYAYWVRFVGRRSFMPRPGSLRRLVHGSVTPSLQR